MLIDNESTLAVHLRLTEVKPLGADCPPLTGIIKFQSTPHILISYLQNGGVVFRCLEPIKSNCSTCPLFPPDGKVIISKDDKKRLIHKRT